MKAVVKILYSPEGQVRQEIRSFVNEGMKDVRENALYDFDEAFDELERQTIEWKEPCMTSSLSGFAVCQ